MTLFPTLQLNESGGWTKGTPYWLIRKRPESMEANILTFQEETGIWNWDSVAQSYKRCAGAIAHSFSPYGTCSSTQEAAASAQLH